MLRCGPPLCKPGDFPPHPPSPRVSSTSAPSTTSVPFPHSTRRETRTAQAPRRPARRCGHPDPRGDHPASGRQAWCTKALKGPLSLLMRQGTRTAQARPRPAPHCGRASMLETPHSGGTRQRSPMGSSMSVQRTTISTRSTPQATSGARRRLTRPAARCGQPQREQVCQTHHPQLSLTVWSMRDRPTTTFMVPDSHERTTVGQ